MGQSASCQIGYVEKNPLGLGLAMGLQSQRCFLALWKLEQKLVTVVFL